MMRKSPIGALQSTMGFLAGKAILKEGHLAKFQPGGSVERYLTPAPGQ
jgi:hypothetical protein